MSQFCDITPLRTLKTRLKLTKPSSDSNVLSELTSNLRQNIQNKEFFDQFKLYDNYNRDLNKLHVIEIMNDIKKNGFLDEMSILVTPKNNVVSPGQYVILDGQHRYAACLCLNHKFTFRIVDNVITHQDILDKISKYNNLQRNLGLPDYRKLKADTVDYRVMNSLVSDTGFTESIMLKIINKSNKDYKAGNFEILDDEYDHINTVSIVNKKLVASSTRLKTPNSYAKSISKILQDKKVNIDILMDKIGKYADIWISNGNENQKVLDLYGIYNYHTVEPKRIPTPEKYTKQLRK